MADNVIDLSWRQACTWSLCKENPLNLLGYCVKLYLYIWVVVKRKMVERDYLKTDSSKMEQEQFFNNLNLFGVGIKTTNIRIPYFQLKSAVCGKSLFKGVIFSPIFCKVVCWRLVKCAYEFKLFLIMIILYI